MSAAEQAGKLRVVRPTVTGRRRRAAVLLASLFFLAVAAVALILAGPGSHREAMSPVLRATKEIKAGSVITADELGATYVHFQDQATLQTFAQPADKSQLVGQVAAVGIPAGSLVPAGLASPQATSGLWDAKLPVKLMPSGLHPGDHVAVVVEGTRAGQPVDVVFMQDVQVLSIGSTSADLWLPAKVVPQMEWYGSHGSIILVRMPAGAVEQNLPAGGGT